jgi:hypothetical protein
MIELTGDLGRDCEILGFANRVRHWHSIINDLKSIIVFAEDYPISDPEELELVEAAQVLFQKINIVKK